MKTLYLECGMGAAGDMLTAALLELLPDATEFLQKMNALGLPDVQVAAEKLTQQGIAGTQMTVTVHGVEEGADEIPPQSSETPSGEDHGHHEHHHAHHHASLADILRRIEQLDVSERVRTQAAEIYRSIADAESHAHQRPVSEIHFHEVGAWDAVADIVGVCLLMEMLNPDRVLASPVCTGSGFVHCAHGILPVPAPATAFLLQGIPSYSGEISGELCTPTGAALLKYFVSSFGKMPVMRTEKIGMGFGKKQFPQLNCVRVFFGEMPESSDESEQISELCCNLDDMTGEEIGFALERLFEAGALDAFTTPIAMKKGRPAVLLTVLCKAEQREEMIRTLFQHTTTLGIREHLCNRVVLSRKEEIHKTKYGDVRFKIAEGFEIQRTKAEFEDLAEMARNHHITLREARIISEQEGNP